MGTSPEDPNKSGEPRPRRAYAFACDSCKRRKIKCGGERPICSGCLKYREECVYGSNPSFRKPPPGSHSQSQSRSQAQPQPQQIRIKRRRTSSPPPTPISIPASTPHSTANSHQTNGYGNTNTNTPQVRTFDASADSPGLQNLATAAVAAGEMHVSFPPHSYSGSGSGKGGRSRSPSYANPNPNASGRGSATGRRNSTAGSGERNNTPLIYSGAGQGGFPRYGFGEQLSGAGASASGAGAGAGAGGPQVRYGQEQQVGGEASRGVGQASSSCRPKPNGAGCTPSTCAPYTPERVGTGSPRSYDQRDQEIQALRANAKQVRLWEVMAFRNLDRTGPEASVAFHLLETYWCWQQPQYLTVYRPTFLRDMSTPGPYCNPFLLNMIYAQALPVAYPSGIPLSSLDMNGSPLQTTTQKDYLDRAKLVLMAELDRPSSVPTIQGLFILAGNECSRGNSSAGWLYAGMAYRMMQDMGIHMDDENDPGFQDLSLEEKEVRRTLWWTAYTWDTMMSLTLARSPTWRETGQQPREFPLDDTTDDMVWTPYVAADGWAGVPDYPPYRSYGRTTFIVNEILTKRYVRKSASRIRSADLHHIGNLLDDWWRELPVCLKLDPMNLPEWCPPIHIFSLNLFYRATLILLHRPGCCSDVPGLDQKFRNICLHAAEEIHELLQLHGRTFAYRNLLYNISYCVCLAASVNVSEIRNPDPAQKAAAKARLDVALHVLETGRAKTPGISRCIDILRAYSTSQGHQTLGANPGTRYHDGPPNMQDNGPMSISHLGSSAPLNYVPMGPVDGLSQHPPFQSAVDMPLFNGQPDPLAALLTSGLDMPDGDLWNWLAFAETQ